MEPVIDAQGVHVTGYHFRNEAQKPSPWRAHWIWADEPLAVPVAMFRREVVLGDRPERVVAWISADCKYRLYINGHLVARGPVDIGEDFAGGSTGRWFYDHCDLTGYFVPGKNVIAAEVFSTWPIKHTMSRGHPGFLFEAEMTLPGSPKSVVATDATWHAFPAKQFPDATTYDAAQEPHGWRETGFDDATWMACHEVPDCWAQLVPSEIPPLVETRYPVSEIEGLTNQTVTRDGVFTVRFDRVLSAYPTLKVKGGKGAILTIKAHRSAKMILGEGEQCFEFPFMTEIAPAFTVEASHVTTPIEILDVGANFTSQPVDYAGAFECSDEALNRIWQVSRWAVQICLQTHHLDSPNHQEPISDPGDYVIEAMVSHNAFALPWLARQDIRKFAWLLRDEHYHNFHTSYSLGWLQMLLDYYDYTGDRTLVQEMAPYVHELLGTYASWRGTKGLISEAPNYMFMDWVNIGGFACHHPPAVIGQGYLTAFYYHGLDLASRVAALDGDAPRMEKYAALRREVAQAFERELWVAEQGRYRDGKPFQSSVPPSRWLPEDKAIETFSPHVNLLAVLYDLAPADRQRAIVEKVMAEKPLNTQPWFMHWVFQAIDHAGLFEELGTAQIRRWQVVPATQSFRENWQSGDFSHGWCSTPLVQLSARVLGITPATPGFSVISIRPALCDLEWARGRVPTPYGAVTVAWQRSRGTLRLDVTIPAGAEADVVVPVLGFRSPIVTTDGKTTPPRVHVTAGSRHFQVVEKLGPR